MFVQKKIPNIRLRIIIVRIILGLKKLILSELLVRCIPYKITSYVTMRTAVDFHPH